ncbi:sperm acrosome membrane-associated protein 6 isoform 2-T3 [Anomaloglossus baeobatrachus]
MMPFHPSDYLLQIVILLCGVQVTTSCLSCFTTPEERARICEYPVSRNMIPAEMCLEAIHYDFRQLDDMLIAFSQIHHIRSYIQTFEKEITAISENAPLSVWVDQLANKTLHFILKVKERITSLQKAARTFSCSRCAQEDCTFPVACPLEMLKVEELGKSIIPCEGLFEFPEFLKVIWKYARNLKMTDLGYFTDIFAGEDLFIMIEPTRMSHIGTYVCEVIDEDDDIILRRFTYLDVIRNEKYADNNLEEDFHRALESRTPDQVEEEKENETSSSRVKIDFRSPIFYVFYAFISCLILTLVFGYLWRYSISVDW